VAFSPDGRRLVSASSDRTIRVWDATPLQGDEGQGTLTFTQHSHEIRSVAFGPSARRPADCLGRLRRAREGLGRADRRGERRVQRPQGFERPQRCRLLRGLAPQRWSHRLGGPGYRQGLGRADRTGSLQARGRTGKSRRGVQPRRPLPGHGKRQQRSRAGLGCRDRPGGRHARYPQPGSLRSGLQPRWRAPGFGEPRRDREALGREAARQHAWTRRKQPASPSARGSPVRV
jgi:hypothetical protein